MIHECTYCDYNTTVKSNIKRHERNKHNEKICLEKDYGNPMKNVAMRTHSPSALKTFLYLLQI